MHTAAPDPFHLQKLYLFLAFSKCVASKRPRIGDVLTLFCWWFWSERETCLVFVEQLVKTHPFAQIQWCISELSFRTPTVHQNFSFFHMVVHAHMVGDLKEFILFPKMKDYFKFLHQKKREKMGIHVCHSMHKHFCHYFVEHKLTLYGKKNVYIHVKRQWNYRWFIEIWQFW